MGVATTVSRSGSTITALNKEGDLEDDWEDNVVHSSN